MQSTKQKHLQVHESVLEYWPGRNPWGTDVLRSLPHTHNIQQQICPLWGRCSIATVHLPPVHMKQH
eukprot:5607050-Amphidinium_carterae.1